MTRGVLLFAHNNSVVDYVKQANFCCQQIKKHLNLPVCLVTSNDVLNKYVFDKIIKVENPNQQQTKTFNDKAERHRSLWSNQTRPGAYDLSPYDETIVMDTDFIVENNNLSKVFDSEEDFLINYEAQHIDFESSMTEEMQYISDTAIKMCWATVFYFKKTKRTRILFDLIAHIRDNWEFYRFKYQITNINYRNDFAFAIALHMMNGFVKSNWPKQLPCKLFYITDRDTVESYQDNQWRFIMQSGLKCRVQDINIHIMNKIGLNRIIDHNE